MYMYRANYFHSIDGVIKTLWSKLLAGKLLFVAMKKCIVQHDPRETYNHTHMQQCLYYCRLRTAIFFYST